MARRIYVVEVKEREGAAWQPIPLDVFLTHDAALDRRRQWADRVPENEYRVRKYVPESEDR